MHFIVSSKVKAVEFFPFEFMESRSNLTSAPEFGKFKLKNDKLFLEYCEGKHLLPDL